MPLFALPFSNFKLLISSFAFRPPPPRHFERSRPTFHFPPRPLSFLTEHANFVWPPTPPTRHFERSRPTFSSAFAPANASVCECEKSLFSFPLSRLSRAIHN